MNGHLFVFEGADGVGKTALIEKLKSKLESQNRSIKFIGFPGYQKGTLGNLVYQIHNNPKIIDISTIDPTSLQLMHIAAHIDSINREIIPSLKKGVIILLDRYWWSTYVYGKISGIEESLLKQMIILEKHYWKTYLPSTLFLIKSPKEPYKSGLDIKQWGRIVSEYDLLLQHESKSYPIVDIINESIEFTRDTVLEILLERLR